MFVDRSSEGSVQVWCKGLKLTFYDDQRKPDWTKEAPPESDPGGSREGLVLSEDATGSSLRFGDWIVFFSAHEGEKPFIAEAKPDTTGSTNTFFKVFRTGER
jgi:hypothetical protein